MSEEIIFRKSVVEDIPQIVELLKSVLGNATEKSQEVWNWKHEATPFGGSETYVAELNGELIAVRAFMQWHWISDNGKKFKFLRAVDTSVSPKHRRKGIFVNLTKYALEKSKEKGYHAIFNTPNERSIGGYLKLGWKINRRITVKIIFNPFFFLTQFSVGQKDKAIFENKRSFVTHYEGATLCTEKSNKFFEWRYFNNPMLKYDFKLFDNKIVFVYRIKEHKFFKECRIVDVFKFSSENTEKTVSKGLAYFSKKFMLVSFAVALYHKSYLARGLFIMPVLSFKGPNLVTRNLNLSQSENQILFDKRPKSWGFQLGDMELF